MNRFESAAARIAREFGVHVEWACANREYIVDGRGFANARDAGRYAREYSASV